MDMQPLVRGKTNGLQHRGPVYGMWFQDILGDDMFRHAPVMVEVLTIGVADAGKIVDEGIKPYIGDKFGIKRQGNAPIQTAFGS